MDLTNDIDRSATNRNTKHGGFTSVFSEPLEDRLCAPN
jgi:hypothetical protein